MSSQGSRPSRARPPSALGQAILHVLRRDRAMKAWYLRIKKRRGAKIAKVAAMRRLATILWHMIKHRQRGLAQGVRPPHDRWMQKESRIRP